MCAFENGGPVVWDLVDIGAGRKSLLFLLRTLCVFIPSFPPERGGYWVRTYRSIPWNIPFLHSMYVERDGTFPLQLY